MLVFLGYFTLNLGITGPAYLSDEVGYLDKAATIAGSTVHVSSSWFGGYSFMISPAFLLSSDPHTEWRIILVLNALMWAGSAALLQYVLRHTHPKASQSKLRLAAAGAMLYPAWLSMSGYAFSTSGFVLVFMAALAAIIKSGLTSQRWLYAAGLLAGYLCWIHPLGFVFLGLFAALLAARSAAKRSVVSIGPAVIAVVFALTYAVLVSGWFRQAMTGSTINDSHYTATASGTLSSLLTMHYWLQSGAALVGLVLFVVTATFGLAVYAAYGVIRSLRGRDFLRRLLQDAPKTVMLLSLLSVILTIAVTALMWGSTTQFRIDQWVYGRYTDMYLLPLVAFGLLVEWRPRLAFGAAAYSLAAGLFLSLVATAKNTEFTYDNKVNIQAFWPMHLTSLVHANYYWLWGLLGACGVMLTWLLIGNKHRSRLVLLLIPIVLADMGNYLYHRTIIRQHATVSSLYTYIKNDYSPNECIGFTTAVDSNERFSLYSYYLHGYDVEAVTWQQWQQEKCRGPYLTYDAALANQPNIDIIGREAATGLYVLTSKNSPSARPPSGELIFR